ncbi:uncharacterized protein LOC113234332 [Hyposmocoma kahamanoa]|uniref:uncharacterized protein LOC113234332 n=1 Tax=Hyposmocoma kahamanoa TaxID=1477025 RepID=UPI000E6D93C3|nr:uncharacterized protein LOC113234332 [Hyposmocoma kahamanoa]
MADKSTSSVVHTEIQAAAVMVCKETATLPRIEPPKRNVAVPLSPSSSSVDQRSEDLMGDIKADRDRNAKEEIISVLRETSMFAAQPEELANRILEQLKEMFNVVDESHITEKPQSKTESIIVYQNGFHTYKASTLDSESQTSYEDNLKLYTLKISHVIDHWLNDFGCHKLNFYDKPGRQAIIDDLAQDIVDRFKYLELNPPKHYLFDDIEHLKYQVFKLISKLTGENNWASLEAAPDLMRRIIKIPLPVLNSTDAHNFKYATENHEKETGTDNLLRIISDRSCSTESFEQTCRRCSSSPETLCTEKPIIMNTPRRMSQLSMFESSKLSSQLSNVTTAEPALNKTVNCENPATFSSVYVSFKEQDNLQVPNAISSDPSASPSNLLTPSKSVKELNNEYDDFVKNWIHEIPIPSSTPEEQNLAEKLRLGIYNAVWKTVAKLKNHPSSIYNPFHYQDLLDDELEDVFQSLPQTEELLAKKHYLKVQFIEKTVNTNEQIKSSFAPDILKQNLVHNILTHIPKTRTDIADENPVKLHEELEILQLAELYILYARFKDEDQLKANVFRTKLVKRLQEIVDELKRTHQKELEHIDRDLYMNELLYAMQQVPLPSDETIKAEADEILLGMEIEQWMGYLPMVTIENTRELFTRRRLKDKLAKKVHNLEKSVNVSNIEGSRLLKMEISAFLDKLPLQKDQSLNLNFMVDELTNRIKNMNNYGTDKFNATGLDNLNFADFSRQIQKASSYNQMPVPNGHQSINTSADTKIPISESARSSGNHVSIPCAQPCNGNNNGNIYGVQQAIPPGINAQLSSGQVPNAPCNGNSSDKTISLWQSSNDASAAGQLQGMQPIGNITTAGGNRSQSFGPPSNSLLRPQQATSLGPVQYIQPGPLQQQPPSVMADTSVYFGPRSAAPIQSPQRYTSFEQQNPASSSFYPGQEIDQSNVQPRSFHECGSPLVAGRPNVLGQPRNVNQSHHESVNSADYHTLPTSPQQIGNPCSVRQAGVHSFAEQSRQAIEPPNQLGPLFYRSTDPQGIKRFTEENMRNRSQSDNQHISQQNVLSEFPASQGSCSQGRPATTGQVSPCPVTCSAPNDMNVQVPPSKPPCPGKHCPTLKRAMETQCPAKGCCFHYDDWDQEELNIRCRCLERFKRNRIRRFGCNPVYTFSPCFCFPDNV